MQDLFSPISLGPLKLRNRIVVPPMCQYSARHDGMPQAWHMIHYGSLAVSGAGMLIVEAAAVEEQGRISANDLGLWDDTHIPAFKTMLSAIDQYSGTVMAVQLGHAGRKASSARPWEGRAPLPPERAWDVIAPSALPYGPMFPVPQAMTEDDIKRIVASFASAARRAVEAGFAVVEIHAAHGYLLHQFLSPISNQREDAYGGSLENRMRLTLDVLEAVRAATPKTPVGMRISGSDWVKGGWTIEDSLILAQEAEKRGCAFMHVSGGGLSPDQKIEACPGYQVGFAATIKAAVNIPVIAVGLITEPEQAQTILSSGQADMVAIGRGMLYDPRWPWHAAAKLGRAVEAPSQYARCEPATLKGLFI